MALISQMLAAPRILIDKTQEVKTMPKVVALLLLVEQLVTSAQEAGELSSGCPRTRTVSLWAAMQGAVQLDKLSRFDATLFSVSELGESITEDLFCAWSTKI